MTAHSISWTNPHNVQIDVPLASLGTRILAYLVDGIIMFTYGVFMLFLYGQFANDFGIWGLFFIMIPIIFYHLLFEMLNDGQSPGKRLLNIKVTSLEGQAASNASLILRWIFRLIDITLFNGLVAVLAVAFSNKKQRIGDLVAATTVIDNRIIKPSTRLIHTAVAPDYEPLYIQAASLHADDIALIRDVLSMEIGSNRDKLVNKLVDKIIDTYQILPSDPPRRFLFTLVKDYNFYQLKEA